MMQTGGQAGDSGAPLVTATILAGGSGTRFWPISTEERPKQFLNLFGRRTMLQHTVDRLEGLVDPANILVLTNDRFVETVKSQLPKLPPENVVGEPMPRDTAAAVALGAAIWHHRLGDHVMLVLPADHVIRPVESFQAAVRSAAEAAWRSGRLYTFGIPPKYPATGYGYLECGDRLNPGEAIEHYRLLRFKEKPDQETARSYLDRGGFYWNSGMFAWSTESILAQIKRHLPEHARRILPLGDYTGDAASIRRLTEAFEAVPKISIDYGIMERAEDVGMVRAEFDWNDVGGWAALQDFLDMDGDRNAIKGKFHGLEASDNIIYSESDDETIALIGVRDLVVVRAGDRTLVVHRDKVEDVKRLVQEMRTNRDEPA